MRLLSFFSFIALAVLSSLGLSAQSVRVIFVSGQAEIQAPGETNLRPITKGEVVTLGTRIVTGADGRVALTPMPGVKSLITPNTDLRLESASETPQADGTVTTAATLDLKQGAVVTDLIKQEGVTYDYNIRTPRGLAGARGTNYTVGVNAAGIETIVVSHGTITFNLLDGRQLSVTAGQIQITDAAGAVRSASSLEDLSAADQAFAQEVAESTLSALESALDAGIALNPEAIEQALNLFQNFGLDVSDTTLGRLSRLREALQELRGEESDNENAVRDQIRENAVDNFQAFLDSLNETQALAFAEIIQRGDFEDSFRLRFASPAFVSNVRNLVDLYLELTVAERNTAVDLGILGNGNIAAVGTPSTGLAQLLETYTDLELYLPDQLLNETSFPSTNAHNPADANHVFFPGTAGNSGATIHNVLFGDADNPGNLYVGATRYLRLNNTLTFGSGDINFLTSPGGTVSILAGEEVSFNAPAGNPAGFSRPITFGVSTGVLIDEGGGDLQVINPSPVPFSPQAILIQAATINLYNVHFKEGNTAVFTSQLGGNSYTYDNQTYIVPNFGSSTPGKVNFLGGVYYGDYLIDSAFSFVVDARGNLVVTSFGNRLNPASITYTPVPLTPFELFRESLSATQRPIFDSFPEPVQLQIFNLNDPDITGTVLAVDPVSGVPYTSSSIGAIIDAYSALSTDARTFVKTLGGATGTGLTNVEATPYIEGWSAAAINQAADLFLSGLDPSVRDALVALGAGDAILGINKSYLEGLVFAASDDTASIIEAGWGRHLQDLVNDSALSDVVDAADGATIAQRSLIKTLRIEPFELAGVLEANDAAFIYNRLDYLAGNLDSAQIELLASLSYDNAFAKLDDTATLNDITAILAHYGSLNTDQQTAARALGLGSLLIDSTRAADITNFYLGLPLEKQEALRDLDLVTAFFDTGTPFATTEANISSALDTFLGLNSLVKNYILTEAEHFNLLAILNSSGTTDNEGKTSRSLPNIVALLNNIALDPSDYETLRDMDLARAILFTGYLEPIDADIGGVVRDALAFYRGLPSAQRFVLRELGIIGSDHVGFLGTDYTSVQRLLTAYANLDIAIRVDTQQIDETRANQKEFDDHASYFFPFNKDTQHAGGAMREVTFASPGDLYVGAVRRLRIDNSTISEPDTTFTVPGFLQHDIYLMAGDSIDLNNTPVSSNVRGIIAVADTITLTNFDFPLGSVASLNSKLGGLTDGGGGPAIYPNWGSKQLGRVNFFGGVTYGGQPINNTSDFDIIVNGNIAIGTTANPAPLPTPVAN